MKNILENKNSCCGCTACYNICPKNAISMVLDEKGFKRPIIDEDKCVNCGLCKKSCPVLNSTENYSINKCYVGYNKSDISRMNNASSGSIFELIAEEVINQNGIVIGACFNNQNKLIHKYINNISDINKLKGSKYLESDLNDIFKFIRSNIKSKKILFVGTPCQVAGLKSFLKYNNDNLICLDLFCHGVPSPKLFGKYIKEMEKKYNDTLINYNFRDKITGWDTYSNTLIFKNKKISNLARKNDYMKLFLSDIALRESCYNCNFKLGNKYSDITLGDFWGIKNFYPEMYDNKGVSAIIINSNKGNEIFKKISDKIKYKECNLEEITCHNPSLLYSGNYPKKRKDFFNDLEEKPINYLVKKYVHNLPLHKRVIKKFKQIIKKII